MRSRPHGPCTVSLRQALVHRDDVSTFLLCHRCAGALPVPASPQCFSFATNPPTIAPCTVTPVTLYESPNGLASAAVRYNDGREALIFTHDVSGASSPVSRGAQGVDTPLHYLHVQFLQSALSPAFVCMRRHTDFAVGHEAAPVLA
jgi:hypothetical protein